MERLTYKNDNNWCVNGTNGALTSDNHANYWGKAINRLAYYENMEEQGRLIICEKEVAKHAKDNFSLLKRIKELSEKLEAAENCIYAVEDALNRGSDNDWAQEAIQEFYEKTKKE